MSTGARDVFTDIYRSNAWRGESRSGIGSSPRAAHTYVRTLCRVMRRLAARSVVDVGCGDWAFSRTIDWSGVDYLGIDVVEDLVHALERVHARPGVAFCCSDAATVPLPEADLLVMKDVLQHWPNADVARFLRTQLPRFRYALLTNDRQKYEQQPGWRGYFSRRSLAKPNSDIAVGDWRPLRLIDPPFALDGRRIRRVRVVAGPYLWVKEMILWERAGHP